MTDASRTGFWGEQLEALRKMREMLMLAFVVREKAFDQLGALEADALVRHISETLKARLR